MAGAPKGNTNAEKWTQISCASNYMISTHGRIYSVLSDKIMKPNRSHAGYLKTDVRGDFGITTMYVHQIVASHFLRKQDASDQVNHVDGNKENNKLSNLEYCTPSDNLRHAYRTGLRGSAENHPNSKLSNKDVIKLRTDRNAGMKYKDISDKYGISIHTAHRIANNFHYNGVQ